MTDGRGMMPHLVVSHRHPGRYAFTVLLGALDDLEAQGHVTVHVARNRNALLQKTRAALEMGAPVVVAWSFYSPSMASCAEELAWLRAQETRPFMALAGGVHATAEPLETLQAGFDRVVVGEGEHALRGLLRSLGDGVGVDDVPGVARLVDGRVHQAARAQPVEHLDTFPPFAERHNMYGSIEITRGCIYACSFCQTPFVQKARFRHRSVENVAHWAGALRRSGHRDLRFISPTSMSYGTQDHVPNLAAVEELLARVREAMGTEGRVFYGTFPSEIRPEHVTPEALAILRKYADNRNIIIGGQSGSDRVLAWSHRGHDVTAIHRAVRVAVENGFEPNVDFMLGMPGEEPPDVEATVSLMERLAADGARVHGHTFMPLPGTPFRHAPPGHVAPAARKRLQVLEGTGALYGQWAQQEAVARDLAQRRDHMAASTGAKPRTWRPPGNR